MAKAPDTLATESLDLLIRLADGNMYLLGSIDVDIDAKFLAAGVAGIVTGKDDLVVKLGSGSVLPQIAAGLREAATMLDEAAAASV